MSALSTVQGKDVGHLVERQTFITDHLSVDQVAGAILTVMDLSESSS